MPANLPPDYFEEERKLRQAKTIDDKIATIERMLAIIPHHKGTDKLIGSLRARISKLKEERERRPQTQKKTDSLYNIRKEGAGQALLVGFPNTGKSALVSALSGEPVESADYPYTTRALQQRMMRYEDILIQLIDTPALGDESQSMWFGNMVRRADAVLLVLALADTLDIEYGLALEELSPHLPALEESGTPVIVVVNKLDLVANLRYLEEFEKAMAGRKPVLPVSAESDVNLDRLKEMIFKALRVVRVYSKLPGKKADLDTPFTLPAGSTIMDCAERVHKDFVANLRYAKLWRKGKLDGMMVSRDFPLEDRDVVELHL